jgi:hypothetical protein
VLQNAKGEQCNCAFQPAGVDDTIASLHDLLTASSDSTSPDDARTTPKSSTRRQPFCTALLPLIAFDDRHPREARCEDTARSNLAALTGETGAHRPPALTTARWDTQTGATDCSPTPATAVSTGQTAARQPLRAQPLPSPVSCPAMPTEHRNQKRPNSPSPMKPLADDRQASLAPHLQLISGPSPMSVG